MPEYTPEKVAEIIAEARYDAKVFLGLNVGTLLAHLAAALTAVSADRDRLHKAITEALEPKNINYGHVDIALERVERILRAALDKEGKDDE